MWREGILVVREFPLTGCGLGGFESAFLKFKTVMGLLKVDYVHNDYLQFLAELGIAGFLVAAVLIGSITRRVARLAGDRSDGRWPALACLGALTAILVHSAFDFNLYTPANAAVLAWICGLGTGMPASSEGQCDASTTEFASMRRHRSTPYR